MELSATIKKQNQELATLTASVEGLKASLEKSQSDVDNRNAEIESQRSINASLAAELESVRGLILAAEQRARKLENENGEIVARFIAEKEKMAAQMNDMNNMVEGMRGFVGSGLSFMKVGL
jgi:chromosome segregation ATPase